MNVNNNNVQLNPNVLFTNGRKGYFLLEKQQYLLSLSFTWKLSLFRNAYNIIKINPESNNAVTL